MVSTNGDPCAIGISFGGEDKTHNLGVGDLFVAVDGDIS